MAKSDPIENALNAIGELRHGASSEQVEKQLRSYLNNRSNLVVAKAAKVAAELHLRNLLADLIAAFDRFWANPAKLDKRCAATTEVAKALYELDHLEPDAYLRGLRHVQKEVSFGPPVDSAADLRGISAQGLLRTRYPDALAEVLNLLTDPEAPARLGAVRALALNGGESGRLLLRLKVLTGDDDLEVISECFAGLLAAAPEQSLSFVAKFIDSSDEALAEAAIWALGQSRQSRAFTILKEKWERTAQRSLRKTLIAALAASRLEEALDFLYGQLRSTDIASAEQILTSLVTYAGGESVKQAVAAALHERNDRTLNQFFQRHFEAR